MGKCDICGREQEKLSTIHGYHLCCKHYAQYQKYRKFLDSNPRTTNDLNEIVIEGDIAKIKLYDCRQNKIGEAIIDIDDIEKVKNYKWRLGKGGTSRSKCSSISTGNGKETYTNSLHRHIMDCPPGMYVDHINGNRFDNRKSNLRICTNQENCFNNTKLSTNTSGYKGGNYDKSRNKWVSEIKFSGKKIFIGRFDNIEDAAFTRYYAETILQKEYMSEESREIFKELENKLTNIDRLKQTVNNKLKTRALI